jgi:hypothetical protein
VLLDLEEVTTNSVDVRLKDATAEVARLELAGRVEGKLYGAVNQIDLRAKCRFDRRTGRIDWFTMVATQTRQTSLVEKAVEANVVVQMKITPTADAAALADAALAKLPLEPTDALCRLQYESAQGGWRLAHDRAWFLTEHYRDLDVFHRVEAGQDIALCKLSRLPKISAAKRPTLSQYQDDVKQALGKSFQEIVEAGQSQSEGEKLIYRVAARGNDGQTPVSWFYYLVVDGQGRRAALAFRVEEKQLDRFGKAGDALVRTLDFVEEPASPAAKKR